MTVVHLADLVAEVADDLEVTDREAEVLVERLFDKQEEKDEWVTMLEEEADLELFGEIE